MASQNLDPYWIHLAMEGWHLPPCQVPRQGEAVKEILTTGIYTWHGRRIGRIGCHLSLRGTLRAATVLRQQQLQQYYAPILHPTAVFDRQNAKFSCRFHTISVTSNSSPSVSCTRCCNERGTASISKKVCVGRANNGQWISCWRLWIAPTSFTTRMMTKKTMNQWRNIWPFTIAVLLLFMTDIAATVLYAPQLDPGQPASTTYIYFPKFRRIDEKSDDKFANQRRAHRNGFARNDCYRQLGSHRVRSTHEQRLCFLVVCMCSKTPRIENVSTVL
mmetsp:Transcript_12834/g.24669  ORF Transcript_12834/g.24669 Transcript_12834/m.24669 type:complete len:274 (+) Transcript_12834:159-980(+)